VSIAYSNQSTIASTITTTKWQTDEPTKGSPVEHTYMCTICYSFNFAILQAKPQTE